MGILATLFRSKVRPELPSTKLSALTSEQIAFWNANGFLILRDFMSREEIAHVKAVLDDEWLNTATNDHEVDVLTGPHAGRTFKMAEAPEGTRCEVYKLNNLFARRSEIRQVALTPKLGNACAMLLEGEPIICNSLNFERGSQQPFHIDTWYMPPPVDGRMVVASIVPRSMQLLAPTSTSSPKITVPSEATR